MVYRLKLKNSPGAPFRFLGREGNGREMRGSEGKVVLNVKRGRGGPGEFFNSSRST